MYIGVHCVYMYTAVCGLGREGGDIHKHTGKEPQGSVSVVLLQDVCVHCTCVYLTVHVCVWVGEGGAGDIHRHTGKEPQGSVSVVLLQDVCVHCTCVYLTVHVCVWVGGGGGERHSSKRSVHVYTVYRK